MRSIVVKRIQIRKDNSFRRKFSTVVVAMSGGIDSSVAAMLLKDQGHDVTGVFMRNWARDDELGQQPCPIDRDRDDMLAVCNRLNIPSKEVEFIKDYWIDVFEPFLEAYESGTLTPNPDVLCNRYIKFNKFREHVFDNLKADYMVTGHYSRILHDDLNACPRLLCGLDETKDQSYFLSMTPVIL